MIRKGTAQDIDNILLLTKACAKDMMSKNIFQWNDVYPNKWAFLKDVERNELFVLETEESIVGCITISTYMDEEYNPISWLTPNKNNIYIHRLAVHPNHQGNGYAQQLMDYAEAHAIKNNYSSIRLDTFSQNPRNLKFYELRGYKKLGEIYFPRQSEYPFYCYELIL
ncbi:GNAT family N-acetyltransferase [Aestuariivivens insulae]|uniref:GNAT family N-acetyltransferase n=1 Tax=Aestuariivivens insulae TaxID=1621988 RepID=UPI001F56EF1E|nr:GNAT family N-acetyltransferase [Aestuariivivens insulae]